jgi:hypothetical protein
VRGKKGGSQHLTEVAEEVLQKRNQSKFGAGCMLILLQNPLSRKGPLKISSKHPHKE